MGTRPVMSVAFRRFTIDAAVVFGNNEDESVVEGSVINLQAICTKTGRRSVSKGKEDFYLFDEN